MALDLATSSAIVNAGFQFGVIPLGRPIGRKLELLDSVSIPPVVVRPESGVRSSLSSDVTDQPLIEEERKWFEDSWYADCC
jgi:hypothetical protein